MLLDAFPELSQVQSFVYKGYAHPHELLNLLFKAGEFEQAKRFFGRLVDARPEDNDPTWITASLNSLSTGAVVRMKEDPVGWIHSEFRQAYVDMIEISERLWCYAEKVHANSLKHKDVQGAAYDQDLELYKLCIDYPSDQPHEFRLDHWKGILTPALQGDFEFQDYIFDQLIEQTASKRLSKSDLDLGAHYFWDRIYDQFQTLGENKSRIREKLIRVAFEVFTADNAVNIKKQLASTRFKKMILGAPHLLLEAKASGMRISYGLYRAALKPLEKGAQAAGRSWQGMLKNDEWPTFQKTLEQLLDGVDVQKIYPRRMSDTAVSVFAEVMPQHGWMEKASEAGLADIFMEDLGL